MRVKLLNLIRENMKLMLLLTPKSVFLNIIYLICFNIIHHPSIVLPVKKISKINMKTNTSMPFEFI